MKFHFVFVSPSTYLVSIDLIAFPLLRLAIDFRVDITISDGMCTVASINMFKVDFELLLKGTKVDAKRFREVNFVVDKVTWQHELKRVEDRFFFGDFLVDPRSFKHKNS